MKRMSFCGLMVASLFVTQGVSSNELKGGASAAATAAASASWQSGTVVKIDAWSGELVLDGARRFSFSPGGGLLVRKQNGASANLADVKAGVSVRLSVVRSSTQVRELWFVE